jgi:hypothetical protein
MEDKSQNHDAELSAQERWRNLWNALSEEAIGERDVSYPEADKVKHELLQRLAHDDRAHLTPSEVSGALERTGRAAASEPEPLQWPEAKEPEQSSGSKAHGREVKPEPDIDRDR